MTNLTDLPNIGSELEKLLNGVGINTPEELYKIGAVAAVKQLELEGDACYNKLYALEGAIRGIRWHDIPKEDRVELKNSFDNYR